MDLFGISKKYVSCAQKKNIPKKSQYQTEIINPIRLNTKCLFVASHEFESIIIFFFINSIVIIKESMYCDASSNKHTNKRGTLACSADITVYCLNSSRHHTFYIRFLLQRTFVDMPLWLLPPMDAMLFPNVARWSIPFINRLVITARGSHVHALTQWKLITTFASLLNDLQKMMITDLLTFTLLSPTKRFIFSLIEPRL